jgi:proline iminopeptidase
MKKWRRRLLIAGCAVGSLLAVTLFLLWRAMGAPLYTPGMVRSGENLRAPLDPPEQPGVAGEWIVENDVRLAWFSQGEGHPLVVLHGGPGYPFRGPQAGLEPLARDFQIRYYDQRGCGRSTRPFDRFASPNFYANMVDLERTLGIGAQLADVERIRRILGQEKLILMGHSFGGFLAALYAAEFPQHVEALVLVAPAGVLVLPAENGGFFEHVRRRLPQEQLAEYDQFVAEYLDFGQVFARSEKELVEMNRRVGGYFLLAASQPDGVPPAEAVPDDNGGWMVQAMYFSMGQRHDYREALRAVRAPVLIVHAEDDLVPVEESRQYADLLPNSRLHLLKTGGTTIGHFPFETQPNEFASVVTAFLADVRPTP